MADALVALDATKHVAARLQGQHLVDEFGVALQARILRHASIPGLDLNRVVVVIECKGQGMKEPVVGLGRPFSDEVVGQMAIVADGNTLMRRFLPRIEMILHDMAIGARLRVIAEVAGALSVTEREYAKAEQNAAHDTGYHQQ